jgi:hypothetical protein
MGGGFRVAFVVLTFFLPAAALFGSGTEDPPLSGQSCACGVPYETGVVWRGDGSNLRLKDIAAMLAPALWFSSEEPLIIEGKLPIPAAHPCDSPSENPVAYYEARRLQLRGELSVGNPEEEDPAFFEKVESLTLRYFFYYPEDIGVHSHVHDLEGAEFLVRLEREAPGCDQVRLVQVTGFAHGLDWYNNTLIVDDQTKFPIMLLVERGKHALCPDKNADGIYVRGYDVNVGVNNAWGIRDGLHMGKIVATIAMLGHGQRPSPSQPRDPALRVLPPENVSACVPPAQEWLDSTTASMGHYELRPADSVPVCDDVPEGQKDLTKMMHSHLFGVQYPVDQLNFESTRGLFDRKSYSGFLPLVSFRADGDYGLSFMMRGWEFKQKYILPKMNWYGREMSLEALVSPTASQIFSWYATAGIDGEYLHENLRFVSEMGVKIRFELFGMKRGLFGLGYKFGGIRIGIRNLTSDFHHVDHTVAVEFGAGVW